MKYFAYSYALSLLCIWNSQNFVKAEVKHYNDDFLLNQSYLSDCTHTEAQLEALKTGNDFLKLRMEMMQMQLDKQNDLFNSLERKINNLPQQIQIMQKQLLLDIEGLKDILNKQIQSQIPNIPPPVDDKLFVLADVKQMLKDHDTVLDNIVTNQNNTEKLLKKANCEHHTQTLENTISNKFAILEKMDEKLTNINSESMIKTEQHNLNRNDITKICYKGENHNLICTSQSYPTSCAMFDRTYCADNKCRISNNLYGHLKPFLVSCNDREEGGGWTVIQRRINGSVDFYRNWSEYKSGFGNIDGEFFIGLDKLHALTATLKPMELLIQLEDFDNAMKYAKYDDFQVGNESEKYKLNKVGSYEGNAGDSLSFHVGNYFSTKDRDNDVDSNECAKYKTGAWWYVACGQSNLNGKYYEDPTELIDAPLDKRGINWYTFHGFQYSLKSVQMMIRPKDS